MATDRRCVCKSDEFGVGFDLCDSCARRARAKTMRRSMARERTSMLLFGIATGALLSQICMLIANLP